MNRIRTQDSGPCAIITLGEHAYATNYLSSELSQSYWKPTSSYTLPNAYKRLDEYFEDEKSGYSERHYKSKPCRHVLETNEFDGSPIRYMGLDCAGGDTNVPLQLLSSSMVEEIANSPISAASEPDWSNLAFKAWQSMRPRIRSAVSLINFGLELKDLKNWSRVGNALSRVRGTAKPSRFNLSRKARKEWGESLPYSDLSYKMPGGRKKMLKDIVSRLTGAHLEASFGIVPFVSDIVETFTRLSELDYKIKLLKRFANRRQKRHYTRRFDAMDPDITGFAPGDGWQDLAVESFPWPIAYRVYQRPDPRYYKRWRWTKHPVYHAQIEYIYSIPKLEEAETKLLALYDTLGLQLDPSIVWNAIPYSFLVDWVVDVSGFLRSLSRDNFPVTIQAVVMTHSVSYSYESEVQIDMLISSSSDFHPPPTWWFDNYQSPRSMGTVYRGTRHFYERRLVANPQELSPTLTAHMPGEKQLLLSGSLLINKLVGGKGPTRGN